MIPSLADYALNDRSLYPQLWDQCHFALAPGLGNTGGKLWDYARGTFAIPTGFNVDRWNPSSSNAALDTVPGEMPSYGFVEGTNGGAYWGNFEIDVNCFSLAIWVWNAGQSVSNCVVSLGATGLSLRLLNTSAGTYVANYSNGTVVLTSTTTSTTERWTHVVAQRSRGNGNRTELWLDGVLEATSSATLSITNKQVALNVGARRDGGTTVATWGGAIDDMRIYQRMLSAEDIQLLSRQRLVAYVPRRRQVLVQAIGDPQSVTVPVATCSGTAVLPTVLSPYTVTVPVATVSATAVLPTATATYVASVPVATAAATAVEVTPKPSYTVSVPVATAAATAVAVTPKASYTVTVPVAVSNCVAVNPTQSTIVEPGVAIAAATAIAPTARASYTVAVPVAAAVLTALLPKTNITVRVPVAICSCTASYTVGGNYITDELGTDTLDEVDLPIEDENTSVPGTITVVVPVAICHCIAIPGQTVAGIATDFRADYEPVGATANHGISLHANYSTPSYTSWVRRSDVPVPSGVQLR